MIWLSLLLLASPPVTVTPPEALLAENWDILRCYTGPGEPIEECVATRFVDYSTAEPPKQKSWGSWCDGRGIDDGEGKHPVCLSRYDHDADLDVDLHDLAAWEAERSAEPVEVEVITFCRYGGCWVVMWHEGNDGTMTPYIIEIPKGD